MKVDVKMLNKTPINQLQQHMRKNFSSQHMQINKSDMSH